ncbi:MULTISPECIES: MDR family MFS transporter [unclassified Herbaspirillum]|uniref:MDR family MFS transporter n=1 Tax=unclassified Herbaspirillum TaxID=2624150 RepID=UPI00115299A6|nr:MULTISPECIES: MDR family MFS transporter [unclassified Herbaspirillum]MBB5390810.1 EmrB/QacA subfamily drug resistance transporter [Herbaspirillum sp. SJZ102]TQK04032.1 EmrB/QacA subfamily drug resistance transporter [Herbaspirillum sp. SJZ106]TQK14622.1 EmrB/QacA subfamily drug resistance transporter [Herbaspirillum sp. SJZ130]
MALHTDAAHSSGQVLPFRESLLATLGICFVIMLVALDQTIVGTALPTIVAELKGFDLYAWVATSYLLTSVITVPIFGRLGDYFGRKPFVIASIIVFVAASALCGMADNMLFLVLARGLQGIGGGMLVGTCFASIADLFPDPRVRLRWQIILSASFGIATAVGPSLGGFLTQGLGWRWVFYCNLPIGVISLFFVWRFVPHIRHIQHQGKMRLDWPGALLISLSLGSLQLLVEMLPKRGITGGMLALLVLAVAAFYALWKWEQRAAQPILPFEMMRDRALSSLFILSVLAGFAMFSLLMYAPLLFQGGFGMTPREAGLLITPLVACITVASIVNGRIITRIPNPNMMMTVGFVLISAACLGVVLCDRGTGNGFMLATMLAGGFGLGLVLPNLTVFAQQAASREHLGIATALLQSLRMIGGMLGTAITGTLVSQMYGSGVQKALESDHAAQWLKEFSDPEVLVNHDIQSVLLAQLMKAGHNGSALLDAARDALVGAIHMGIAIAIVAALAGLWMVRRVPPIKFGSDAKVEPVMSE